MFRVRLRRYKYCYVKKRAGLDCTIIIKYNDKNARALAGRVYCLARMLRPFGQEARGLCQNDIRERGLLF